MGKIIFSFNIFFACVSLAFSASDNRGLFPIGEKEMYMSNTGIALTESSGSVYYNPAGLATITATKLSLSSNTYSTEKKEYESLQTLDGQNFPFSMTSSQSIPSSLISAWKGDRVNFAFGIFVPLQLKSQDAALFTTPSYDAIQFTRSQSFQVLMAGGSLAGQVNENLAVGLSCFYTTHQKAVQIDISAAPKTTTALKPAIAYTFFNYEISGAICQAGIQHAISENVLWGLVVKSPLIKMSKHGSSARFAQNPIKGEFAGEGPKDVDPQTEIPGEVGVGVKLDLSERLKFYSDVNYQAASTYYDDVFLSVKYEHVGTVRASGGVQFKISNKNDILAGFAYNPSSLKDGKTDAQENYFVGTFGIQTQTESSVFGLGIYVAQSYGKGDVTNYNAQFQELNTYSSNVKTSLSGLLISSGFSF